MRRQNAALGIATPHLSVIPVFQVALITAISAAVLIATHLWSVRLRRGLGIPHEARRVLVAVERASWASVRRCARRLPWPIVGVLCVLVVANLAISTTDSHLPIAFLVIGALVTFILGLLASLSIAYMCGSHSRRHFFLGVSSAAISLNRCLSVSISSAATLVIGAEVAGMIAASTLFGLLWLLARGAIDPSASADAANAIATKLTPYFSIGSILSALSLQQTGIVCLGAARLPGPSGFSSRTGLSALDPRNPSVLVDAVARQLGSILPRILDAFVGGALLATISLHISNLATTSGWPLRMTSIGMFPVLLRGFGLLASLVGLMVTRTAEHEDVRLAFVRGQLVSHAVLASAFAGLVLWLIGGFTSPVAAAGIVGLGLPLGLEHVKASMAARRRSVRLPLDNSINQDLVSTVDACALGLRGVVWPISAFALVMIGGATWYQRGTVSQPDMYIAMLVGLSAPAALTSWGRIVATANDFGALGNLAKSVGRVSITDETAFRLRRLSDATESVTLTVNATLNDSGAILCLLAGTVALLTHRRALTTAVPSVASFAISLLVFLPLLLAVVEGCLASAKTARTQTNELDRQLRGMRREGTQVSVPEDFVPSYRSCVELLARDAAQGGQVFVVTAIASPVLAAQLAAGTENIAGPVALSLAFYASIAAAVGLFSMNVGHAAAVASCAASRGNPSLGVSQCESQALVSEPARLVEFMGHSIGASVPLLTKAVAFVTLAVSAMLI